MQPKDYYTILELPASATLGEIKTAYRRLAHQYHPDKNGNDLYAAAQFEIIKEAYEVLSNPSKKDYYLQQRWYNQSTGRRNAGSAVTPVAVLKQVLELDKYVARIDEHRMDKEGLYDYICDVLSDETIEKLNSFNETDINKVIILTLVKSGQLLPFLFANKLSVRFMKLNTDSFTVQSIQDYIQHSRSVQNWTRYKPWVISLVVILLCILIYLLSNQGYLD